MPLVSVTRLHLRSVRFLPAFVISSLASVRQAQAAPGFLGGWTALEGLLGFWTATCWEDEPAMRAFRNRPPHLDAMRRLQHWCDEASYVHWEQASAELPTATIVQQRLSAEGTVSKVAHPSPRHREGRTATERIPRRGAPVHPRPATR